MRRADFARAIDVYRSVLSADPDNADVRAALADAYFRSGNRERAFHHFHRAATLYMNRSAIERALSMLQSANGVSPNEPDILFRTAECLKSLGRSDAMREPLLALVQAARSKGDRRRLWALEELTQMFPEDVHLAEQYAETLGEAERLGEAVHLYKQVASCFDSASPDFARLLARAAVVAAPQLELAVEVAKFAVANGHAREALNMLVPHYEERPEHIPVLETLLTALSAIGAMDKIIPARIELIKARIRLNQRPQGLHDVAELVQVAPRHAQALEVAAHAYSLFGEAGSSKETWRIVLRLAAETGLRAECDRAVLAILKLDPDDEEALGIGAKSLHESGRSAEAAALEKRLQGLRDRPRSRPRASDSSPSGELRRQLARIKPIADSAPPVAAARPVSRATSKLQAPVLPRDEPFEEATHTEPTTGTMVLTDDDFVEVTDDPGADRRTQESAPAFVFDASEDESTVGAESAAPSARAQASVAADPVGPINARLRRVTNTQLATTDEVEAIMRVAEQLGEEPALDGELLVEDEATMGVLPDEEQTMSPESDGGFQAHNLRHVSTGGFMAENPRNVSSGGFAPDSPAFGAGKPPARGSSQATYYGLEDPPARAPASRARPPEEVEVDLEDAFEVPVEELRFGAEEVTSRLDPVGVPAPTGAPAKPRRGSLVADLVEETEVFPSIPIKR